MDPASVHSSGSLSRIGAWLFAVSIVGAALAAGTVHTVTLCVVAVPLAAGAMLVSWDAPPTQARRAATILFVTGCTLTAYTAVQCIPMPMAWLATLAPRNADVWSRALLPLGKAAPIWAPISVDPTATRIEVLKGVAYLLAFVTALGIARRRAGFAFLSRTVVFTGLALGLAALLHPAFGAHRLYGVWQPRANAEVNLRHLAPLLNPNNLAGYLNIALCLALAGALAPDPYWPRPILAALAIVLAGTQIWVASRGGVVAMVFGAALVLAISRGARLRRGRTGASISIVAGLLAAVGVVAFVLSASEQASSELFDADISKVQLVTQAMGMVRSYGIWGTGRGAFESAFPAFRQIMGYHDWNVTFTHPENVVAQWLVEWGVPLGIVAMVAIAVALRPSAVLARSSPAAGAWAAIVAFAVQNLVDLGTEVPGLMLAPVVCAAIVTGGTSGQQSRWAIEQWATAPRIVAAGGALGAACALIVTLSCIGHELGDDRDRLREAAIDQHSAATAVDALARTTMLRHPAEPFLPFIVAVSRAEFGDREESPLPWLEATLERANVYGPAHLVLAHWLAPHSPAQARLEYRLTGENANELVWFAINDGARLVANYDDAMELIPEKKGIDSLLLVRNAIDGRLPATATRLDEEIVRRAPENPSPLLRSASAAVEDLSAEGSAPWCDGAKRVACANAALVQTDRIVRVMPTACEPRVLRARALVAAGDVTHGLTGLESATDAVTDRGPCLQALFDMAQAAGNERIANQALDKLANLGCVEDRDCATNLEWVGAAEEHRGNQRKALALFNRAYQRAPDGPHADVLLATMARLAAASDLHAAAADDYDRLARRHPEDGRWENAALEQRNIVLAPVVIP